jgi:inosine-uridine nucleoside N-ribohydrolase
VHAHPHQVTICALGPLTNLALAISIDSEFASLSKGLVMMGGSLNPHTDDPEFATSPTHEFNLWFDPEAAHIVLHADWPRVDVTTADVSLKAPFTQAVLDSVVNSQSPAARYIGAWSKAGSYMWDELAASFILDPTLITQEKVLYMDVDLSHGPSYGATLTWSEALKPATATRSVHAQMDLDLDKFHKEFVELMMRSSQ